MNEDLGATIYAASNGTGDLGGKIYGVDNRTGDLGGTKNPQAGRGFLLRQASLRAERDSRCRYKEETNGNKTF